LAHSREASWVSETLGLGLSPDWENLVGIAIRVPMDGDRLGDSDTEGLPTLWTTKAA